MKLKANSLQEILQKYKDKPNVLDVLVIWENDISVEGAGQYLICLFMDVTGERKYIYIEQDQEIQSQYDLTVYRADIITKIVEYETFGKVGK